MRTRIPLLIGIVAALFLGHYTHAQDGKKESKNTWVGEVVCLQSYIDEGLHGADHEGLMKAMIKNGQPAGLLVGKDELFVLSAYHKDAKPFEDLKDHAGMKVKIKGKSSEKHGVKIIIVTASEAVK